MPLGINLRALAAQFKITNPKAPTMAKIHFVRISGNTKTGPIPVTTTDRDSCPSVCPLKDAGCYADLGHIGMHWRRVSNKPDNSWDTAMASIAALPNDTLWRHNQAGDLPHNNQVIDAGLLASLVKANKGKNGFTYTHHDVSIEANKLAIEWTNSKGFTVNLSANSLEHADKLKSLNVGPVVTIMPTDCDKVTQTPAGNTVIQCPATYQDDVTCATCGICQVRDRKAIIGFPVHGSRKAKAHKVFMMKAET